MILQRILEILSYDPKNPLIFNSSFFLFFFILIMLFYPLIVNKIRVRTWYLILLSVYFYYKTSGEFVLLLLITAGVNFIIGNWIYNAKTKGSKNALM